MTSLPAAADGQQRLALAAGSLAVVAWGIGPVLVRAIGTSTPTVVFWRFWMAQPVMIGVAYLTGGRLSLPLLRRAFVPGLLFSCSMFMGFASYQATSIANATLIGSLTPAVILLVAPRLFGEGSTGRQRLMAAAAFVGVAAVVFGAAASSGAHLRGDLYAAANLAIWTVYFIAVKRQRDQGVHAASFVAGVFLIAAIAATPWALLASHDLGSVGAKGYLLVLVMVIGPGLLGHGSMTWAQRHLTITTASLLTLGHPVVASIVAWIIEDERLTAVQFAGAAVVLGALAAIVADARSARSGSQTALPVGVD